jgi:SpoVK/Ycf46/Vps4 family AAA+-type ATPase
MLNRFDLPKSTGAYVDDMSYIEEEMTWVELRLRRLATAAKLEEAATGDGDEGLLRTTRRSSHGAAPESLRRLWHTLAKREAAWRAHIDQRLMTHRSQGGKQLVLDLMCEQLGLTLFERWTLLLAAGPTFSRRFPSLIGEMDEWMMESVTVEAVFKFQERSLREMMELRACFGPRGPLIANELIIMERGRRARALRDFLEFECVMPGHVFERLVGRTGLDEELCHLSSIEAPRASFAQLVLPERDRALLSAVIERHDEVLKLRERWGFDETIRYGRALTLLFDGPPGTGKTMTAHAIADQLGLKVMAVDLVSIGSHADGQHILPGLFREARLQRSLLFFDECEVIFADRRNGNLLMTMLLTELERFDGVAILATNLPEQLDPALNRRISLRLRFTPPDAAARAQLWERHLPRRAPLGDDVDVALLAKHELTGGLIKNAVLQALSSAVHEAGAEAVICQRHLEEAARQQRMQHITQQGGHEQVPKARLQDVVLPRELRAQVCELIDAVQTQDVVMERWGMGERHTRGRALVALLEGPPGTGKTFCAEAIAGELGRPLIVGSLPALMSSLVGGTERGLAALFERAAARDAVLLLDEVDALLRARHSEHSASYELSVVNTMLALLEGHAGVVLLATNLPQALDRAVERRLGWRLVFHMPGAEERLAIWERLLSARVPLAQDVDLRRLAERYALSGAHLRNAALRAARRAARQEGQVTMMLLERSCQEELQRFVDNP